MRQQLIFLLVFICFAYGGIAQSRNKHVKVDDSLVLMISGILMEKTHSDSIVVTNIDSQNVKRLINKFTETDFLRNLKTTYATTDSSRLIDIVVNAPLFMIPKRLVIRNVIMLTNVEALRNYRKIQQKYNYIPFIEITNLVLTPDKQTCFFFYHIIDGSGESVVLHKNSKGIWSIISEYTDWLE